MGLGHAAHHRQRISDQADQRNAQSLELGVVLQIADLLDAQPLSLLKCGGTDCRRGNDAREASPPRAAGKRNAGAACPATSTASDGADTQVLSAMPSEATHRPQIASRSGFSFVLEDLPGRRLRARRDSPRPPRRGSPRGAG